MADTLESIQQAFVDWRRTKSHGPYPTRLRRRAMSVLTEPELIDLGRRLGLTTAQVKRWSVLEQAPIVPTLGHGGMAPDPFYEITPMVATATPIAALPTLDVELHMPSGSLLRLRGAVDATLVRALVQALHNGGAT